MTNHTLQDIDAFIPPEIEMETCKDVMKEWAESAGCKVKSFKAGHQSGFVNCHFRKQMIISDTLHLQVACTR